MRGIQSIEFDCDAFVAGKRDSNQRSVVFSSSSDRRFRISGPILIGWTGVVASFVFFLVCMCVLHRLERGHTYCGFCDQTPPFGRLTAMRFSAEWTAIDIGGQDGVELELGLLKIIPNIFHAYDISYGFVYFKYIQQQRTIFVWLC